MAMAGLLWATLAAWLCIYMIIAASNSESVAIAAGGE